MATRFLLPCVCGREIPVDAGQAGDTTQCECGERVPIPKLGELRLLPRIQSAERQATWSARHGLITLAGLVAGVCLILGVYAWAVTPKGGAIDVAAETERVDAFFDGLSPVELWNYWHQQTVPIARHGLQEESSPRIAARQSEIDRGKAHQRLAFGTAGLAILFCIATALWRPAARRP